MNRGRGAPNAMEEGDEHGTLLGEVPVDVSLWKA
jgi:hypothetical protein